VILAVRNLAKGEAARAEMLDEHPPGRAEVRRLDLADLASSSSSPTAWSPTDARSTS
jgi:hypothetical protein